MRSISMLSGDSALVRFATTRTDPGTQSQAPQLWAAVLRYKFSGGAMRAEDRLVNPLGFQVVHYRRDAEMLPVAVAASEAPLQTSPASAPAPVAAITQPSAGAPR